MLSSPSCPFLRKLGSPFDIPVQPTFDGNLPGFILSLKALQKLDLAQNSFIGSFYTNLGTLPNLRDIDLSYNELGGSLTDVLSANPNWETVTLWLSGLDGGLPSDIGRLKKLRYLSVNNFDTKTLPQSVSQLTAIEYLSLNANEFTGTVPDLSATKLVFLYGL
jgi:Leucine-rich repeat (LRR) protein